MNVLSAGSQRNSLILILFLISILSLSACGGGVTGDDENFIVVNDQTSIHLDEILIESAVLDRDAIVVIYASNALIQNAKTNLILGTKFLEKGQHENVVVKLERDLLDNETVYAELRADNGVVGDLELNIDTVIAQSTRTSIAVNVIHSTVPYLEAFTDESGKYVAIDPESVVMNKVVTNGSSWLVVHENNSGELGEVKGNQLVGKGHSSKVDISLNPKRSLTDNEKIFVVIYKNVVESENDGFDIEEDELLLVDGLEVKVSLDVTIN